MTVKNGKLHDKQSLIQHFYGTVETNRMQMCMSCDSPEYDMKNGCFEP